MGDARNKKKYYFRKGKNKFFLESGFKGFFCTCNFREKDCVKEAYNILNEYADKLYPESQNTQETEENAQSGSEEEDIGATLKRELETMKSESSKSLKHKRFQAVETGASNCIFIKTNLPNPEELTTALIKDLLESKSQKTRYLLRLVPIMSTCKANLPDIMESAGQLFDKHFLKESSTFAIIFNRRFNSSVSRELIIKELAELIATKNADNKADLKNPKKCVIVEVIKGMCLLSIVENYYTYKKYNLVELCKDDNNKGDENNVKEDTVDKECSPSKKQKKEEENSDQMEKEKDTEKI